MPTPVGVLGCIDALAVRVMEDGILNYASADGQTLFELLAVLAPEWYKKNRLMPPRIPANMLPDPPIDWWLWSWLVYLNTAYSWKHSFQNEEQKEGVYRTFVLMFLWFR